MRFIGTPLASLGILLFVTEVVAQRVNFVGLSAAKPPVVVESHGLSAAALFPTEYSARILVVRGGKPEVSSPAFDFHSVANYGAAWVEGIEIKSSMAFTVHIRMRQTCGPGIYDYTFARQGGNWVLARLDREESQCTDAGAVADWKKSYNYLRGTITTVKFQDARTLKPATRTKRFKVVPLTEFRALDARHEVSNRADR